MLQTDIATQDILENSSKGFVCDGEKYFRSKSKIKFMCTKILALT